MTACLAAVALFIVLRPNDADDADVATPPPPTATGATPQQTRPAPPPSQRRATVLARVAVRNGRVIGGLRRIRLSRGQRVRLVVSADVDDHVHVHGYELMRDVAPGSPARLRFRATIPGRFEIELEESGLLIAELEVRP